MSYLNAKKWMLILAVAILASCGGDENPDPTCTIGSVCNDGDNTTLNDKYNSNCECVGTPTACTNIGDADGDGLCFDEDCDDLDASNVNTPGLACDDGNSDTDNDVIGSDCVCKGTCTITGQTCDDADANTFNDVYNADCECEGTAYGNVTDPRDAQTYRTVMIGTQTWMADNLNYDGGVSWCYGNTPANCTTYGRLYDWESAKTGCPVGWHLPTDEEWATLVDFLGGAAMAGGKMKEAGTAHWSAPNTGATNSSGFNGLPGGFRLVGNGEFLNLRTNGTWWSATEDSPIASWHRNLLFGGEGITRGSSLNGDAFSVRCIKD